MKISFCLLLLLIVSACCSVSKTNKVSNKPKPNYDMNAIQQMASKSSQNLAGSNVVSQATTVGVFSQPTKDSKAKTIQFSVEGP